MENRESEAKWYVLHTFSGYENVAKENLKLVIENFNLQDRIFDIVIPMQQVVEEKKGKQVLVDKKLLPSYILIKMIYGDDIWHAVTRTRGVTGFAGPKGRPLALTEAEIQRMHLETVECKDINVGDTIEVLDGPFMNYLGKVVAIDNEKKRVKADFEVLERNVTMELDFTNIKKVNV